MAKMNVKTASRPAIDRFDTGQQTKPVRGTKRKPRQSGQALGAGFAALNGTQLQTAEHFVAAIVRGQGAAQQREAATRNLSQDPEHLRSLGFYGRTNEDL
jgi:hypothetical protein